jgi:serine phosphatase RsbU (regulator of sigma subunit)/anti-sigma regulatory factor (Ser/Thr protein kinase)
MVFLGELRVESNHDSLRTISHFIHGIGHRLSLTEKVVFDLELAVEEAATNIINHAYPDDPHNRIMIGAEQIETSVQITLTDWGVPFDPTKVRPFDLNAPVEARIRGGMGLHFIHTLMDQVEREIGPDESNILRITKHIEKTTPGSRPPSTVQELNAMRTISEVMTSNIDLNDLLNLILNKLVLTINAERGTIYLVDEERGELWSKVVLDDVGPLPEIRVKIGDGIAGHVAQSAEILNIEDAYSDPRFNQSFDQVTGFTTRSILTAPMFNPQQRVIGVVQLLNKKGGPFTGRDERLLAAMSSQAAISIENARLYQQEIQQKVLSRELETAHAIQISFLPATIPQYPGWDLAAVWKPIQNVAGDFYDFYHLEDGRLAVLIADVSGKGIPAALFMALSVTVLRFGMSLNLSPGEVTRRANELIITDQRSRMFATVFVTYLDLDTGEMQIASAGHNPAILYHADQQTCEYRSASGVALGIFKGAAFAEETASLAPGDILVLYTDGITEVLNDDEDEFGEERLEHIIMEYADRTAQQIATQVIREITVFAGDQNLFDDATLVVVKRT